MPVSKPRSTRAATRPARRTAGPAPKTVRRETTKPFLRFYHSDDLRKRTVAVVTALERSPDPLEHRDALAEIVVELTNAGVDYYLMKPLEESAPGFIVRQTANLGMAGTQQVIGTVIRNVVGRMEGSSLVSVCGSIRKMMA